MGTVFEMDAHAFSFVYSRLFAHLPVLNGDISLTLYLFHHLYFLKLFFSVFYYSGFLLPTYIICHKKVHLVKFVEGSGKVCLKCGVCSSCVSM